MGWPWECRVFVFKVQYRHQERRPDWAYTMNLGFRPKGQGFRLGFRVCDVYSAGKEARGVRLSELKATDSGWQ